MSYLKRWETGREPNKRNDKGKKSSARLRQLRKAHNQRMEQL